MKKAVLKLSLMLGVAGAMAFAGATPSTAQQRSGMTSGQRSTNGQMSDQRSATGQMSGQRASTGPSTRTGNRTHLSSNQSFRHAREGIRERGGRGYAAETVGVGVAGFADTDYDYGYSGPGYGYAAGYGYAPGYAYGGYGYAPGYAHGGYGYAAGCGCGPRVGWGYSAGYAATGYGSPGYGYSWGWDEPGFAFGATVGEEEVGVWRFGRGARIEGGRTAAVRTGAQVGGGANVRATGGSRGRY